jgi:hypothetical protein
MAAVVRYWPTVVAGLYVLYVVAATLGGSQSAQAQLVPAVTAFLGVAGVNHGNASTASLAAKVHDALFPRS